MVRAVDRATIEALTPSGDVINRIALATAEVVAMHPARATRRGVIGRVE